MSNVIELPRGTVADLMDRWIAECVDAGALKESSRVNYRNCARHIREHMGTTPIQRITYEQVRSLVYDRLNAGQGNIAHTVLIQALEEALRRQHSWSDLGVTPAQVGVAKLVRRRKVPRRTRYFSEAEYADFLDAIDTLEEHRRLLWTHAGCLRLLTFTGCRRNEIAMLTWKEYRRAERVIMLRDSKTGPRRVPLSPEAIDVLDGLPRDVGPFVFPGQRGAPHLGTQSVHRAFKRVCELAGIEGATVHCLRHSLATAMLRDRVPLDRIARVLGHSQVYMTDRYAHAEVAQAVEDAAAAGASISAARARKRAQTTE